MNTDLVIKRSALSVYTVSGVYTLWCIAERIDRTTKHTLMEVWAQYYVSAAAVIGAAMVLIATPISMCSRMALAVAILSLSMAINMRLSAKRWEHGAPNGTTDYAKLDEAVTQPMEARP